MKNYVARGDILTVTAAADIASGIGILTGALFGVTTNTAKTGESLVINVGGGVFDLVKVGSQAWTVGAKVYWDDTNKRCTTVATDNTLIGVAVLAVGSGAGLTTGRVRLNGTA